MSKTTLKTTADQIAYIDGLIVDFRRGKNIEDDLKFLRDSLVLKQAGAGWYKSEGNIVLKTAQGKTIKTVPCFRHKTVAGLFINKAEGGGKSRWNITHDISGLAIAGASTLNNACKCVKDYLSGIDWDKGEAELASNSNPDYPKIEAALKGLREAGYVM